MQIISDGLVKILPYSEEENICKKFTEKDWHKIINDIDTDRELAYITEQDKFYKAYIVKTCVNNTTIAFLLIKPESVCNKVVSIHGGGWGKSMYFSILYYRALILMIQFLWQQGHRVRTSYHIENNRAYRFLHSIGFVKYKEIDRYIYMWISEKRLRSSRVYR